MSEKKHLTLAAAVLALATLLSRCAGLIRDVVIAAFFGAGYGADAFFMAFTLPNLLRRFFAEGSLTAAFVPTFSAVRQQQGEAQAHHVACQCWGLLLLVMALVTAVGILLAPLVVPLVAAGFGTVAGKLELTVRLTQLMFPYLFFVSLLALVTGILNVYGHYFVPALSPVMLNAAMILAALLFSSRMAVPIEALAWGVVVGGLMQLGMSLPLLRRYGVRLRPGWDWRNPAVVRITRLMLPGVVGVAIYQINVVVTRLLSSFLAEGSLSYLYYSQRLFEFPQGIFVVSIAQAVLPSLSRHAVADDRSALLDDLRYGLSLILLITLPAAAGLLLCAKPLFSLLFMQGAFDAKAVHQTALALMAYAPGLVFVGLSRVLVPVFYARQNTRTPVWISFWTLLVNAIAGLLLMRGYGHVGLALALTLSALFNALALGWVLRRQLGPLGLRPLFWLGVKASGAAAGMAFVVFWLLQQGDWLAGQTWRNGLVLLGAVGSGGLAYLLLCRLLGVALVRDLGMLLRRRRPAGR
ncbi:MAG: murein biosynthesis integral membrane protein MurJ [Desulfuromonas sp.]